MIKKYVFIKITYVIKNECELNIFSNYTTINILTNFQIKKYENGNVNVNVLRKMTM
jgi:hypothetical protein